MKHPKQADAVQAIGSDLIGWGIKELWIDRIIRVGVGDERFSDAQAAYTEKERASSDARS